MANVMTQVMNTGDDPGDDSGCGSDERAHSSHVLFMLGVVSKTARPLPD